MRVDPSAGRLARRLWILEIICLITGLAALGWLVSVRLAAARDQRDWARELETQLAARHSQVDSANSATTAVGSGTMAVRRRATSGIIGRIEAPRLGISVITREGTDPATLERAVGHIAHTALPGEPGNAAFAGHRDTFFRGLRQVRTGDRIAVTTRTGRHEYVVRDTRVVSPDDVSVLDPTPAPTLTLVTCFPFRYIGPAPERFIVRADLLPSNCPNCQDCHDCQN
jgi:sortase A